MARKKRKKHTRIGFVSNIKINNKVIRVINIVCGAIIIFYGLKLVWNYLQLAWPGVF